MVCLFNYWIEVKVCFTSKAKKEDWDEFIEIIAASGYSGADVFAWSRATLEEVLAEGLERP